MKKTDVNLRTDSRYSALIMAINHSSEKMVRLLMKNPNLDLNAESYVQYPLIRALTGKKSNILKMLLDDKRINVNIQTMYDKRTPLMYAIMENNHEGIDLLLDREDINLDILDVNGENALFYAIRAGKLDLITSLIAKKINLKVINNKKETASEVARKMNNGSYRIIPRN